MPDTAHDRGSASGGVLARWKKESLPTGSADNRIWWGDGRNNSARLSRLFLSEVKQGGCLRRSGVRRSWRYTRCKEGTMERMCSLNDYRQRSLTPRSRSRLIRSACLQTVHTDRNEATSYSTSSPDLERLPRRSLNRTQRTAEIGKFILVQLPEPHSSREPTSNDRRHH